MSDTNELVDELTCYVHVSGEASEEEDEGVQGIYAISINLSEAVDLTQLSDDQKDKIAAAALDEFHDNQGISMLEDFSISVYLPTGEEADELIKPIDSDFSASASYDGMVDLIDLPPALAAVLQ